MEIARLRKHDLAADEGVRVSVVLSENLKAVRWAVHKGAPAQESRTATRLVSTNGVGQQECEGEIELEFPCHLQ
jgi:hypothetical protein